MLKNDRGSFLMGLLLLISVIALTAAGAARSSLREKARVSREYNEAVAQSAAESCIEKAKALIASAGPRAGEYQMGNEQFSSLEGREVNCSVKYSAVQYGILMEASGVVKWREGGKRPGKTALVERSVSILFSVSGSPLSFQAIRREQS
jgi:Tfp pilus assembly protein PilX